MMCIFCVPPFGIVDTPRGGLTDVVIRKAKPAEKSHHLTDANGLSVFITTAGGKLWRYRYRYDGKAAILSLVTYPDVSLLEAREMREEARKQLKSGLNPSLERKKALRRKIAATNNTFEVIAREWYELQKSMWTERHAADVIGSLERDVILYLALKYKTLFRLM